MDLFTLAAVWAIMSCTPSLLDIHRAEMRWQILAISDMSPLCNLVLMSISELSRSAGRQGHMIQWWESADAHCNLNHLIIIIPQDNLKLRPFFSMLTFHFYFFLVLFIFYFNWKMAVVQLYLCFREFNCRYCFASIILYYK